MDAYRMAAVNRLGAYGRWAFAEFTDMFEIDAAFGKLIDEVTFQDAAA